MTRWLDGRSSDAVTVLTPPRSPMDAGSSARVTTGSTSSFGDGQRTGIWRRHAVAARHRRRHLDGLVRSVDGVADGGDPHLPRALRLPRRDGQLSCSCSPRSRSLGVVFSLGRLWPRPPELLVGSRPVRLGVRLPCFGPFGPAHGLAGIVLGRSSPTALLGSPQVATQVASVPRVSSRVTGHPGHSGQPSGGHCGQSLSPPPPPPPPRIGGRKTPFFPCGQCGHFFSLPAGKNIG